MHNFTWLYNGIVRGERNTPLTIITRDGSVSQLTIHGIPAAEAGNYTCVAYALNTSAPLQDSIILKIKGKRKRYY